MALRPLRRWTNPLAWAVWNQRQKNKERGSVIPPLPSNCRYYLNFDGSTYIDLQEQINLSTDYEISFKYINADFTNRVFIGNQSDSNPQLSATSTTEFRVADGTNITSVILSETLTANGDLRFVKSGVNNKIYVNGILAQDFNTTSSASTGWDRIANNFSGILYDVKFYDGGDKDTGALIHSYSINDNGVSIADGSGSVNGSLAGSQDWILICENNSIWLDNEAWIDADGWID